MGSSGSALRWTICILRNYPEVIVFCIFFALAVIVVEVRDTGIPIWSLILLLCDDRVGGFARLIKHALLTDNNDHRY